MSPPASIASAARTRLRAAAKEIKHSLKVIAEGRRGEAEPDPTRRTAVLQVRRGMSFDEARRAAPKTGPESIWGRTIDFVGVAFFERGRRAARPVCRISLSGGAVGTGFLISPRLLITNNHVIGSPAEARGMAAEFDYELDIDNQPRPVTRFSLAPDQFFLTDDRDNLDYTIVALGPRVAGSKDLPSFGALPLSNARNKHALGDFVSIIQHPDGRLKEAVVRENQLVGRPKDVGTVLHYVTDTEPGSSGSPVFNVLWDVVALHHWGGPHRELFDQRGVPVPRTVNEGIRISAIFTDINTRKATLAGSRLALLEEALTFAVESTGHAASETDGAFGGDPTGRDGAAVSLAPDGTATWRIPLSVSVRLGGLAAPARQPSAWPSAPPPDGGGPGAEVKLVLDANYANRTGYKADFLPSVTIPLPTLSAAQKRTAARNKERVRGDDPYVLRYEHFSVVMNGKRRLAFYTATNIDGANSKDFNRDTGQITEPEALGTGDGEEGAEAAELWLIDRRIAEDEQTPPDLFSDQITFDASGRPIPRPIPKPLRSAHQARMFQQGHLTRRQDPLWGPDAVVIRANTDTFHVTNRAPQIGYFNMGLRKPEGEAKKHPGGTLHWRALEDFVLQNARADQQRVTVFTGPVFDDPHDYVWSRGRPDMRGFKAPRKFWKLVLRDDNGRLQATALVADQSPLIDFLPEMLEVGDEEAKRIAFEKVAKYQVSVPELERQTALDFGGTVRTADTFVAPGPGSNERRVEKIEDVSLGRRRAGRRKGARSAASRRGKKSTRSKT